MPRDSRPGLTIVTPTFEKHAVQFERMLGSLAEFCTDPEFLNLIVVVEKHNVARFTEICAAQAKISFRIVTTEDILADYGVPETPGAFLKRIGKFTFQTLKKLGGLARARTAWSLVLDSEGLFLKPFSAERMLQDYAERKYVFYTQTRPRGPLWRESTGYRVTENCGTALGVTSGDRWYMEYFHWFYETDKLLDMVQRRLTPDFFDLLRSPSSGVVDHFENVLYYLYLQHHHADEYDFVDFKKLIDRHLPSNIAARFKLDELPFSLFGNDYLLNILSPAEVPYLAGLFEAYRLPFIRLEPPVFNTGYLPALTALEPFVATISSHHMGWLRKKIAVCISGEFRHTVHRVPEHQVRHLAGFLTGVECDVYVHGWSNASEALIIDELKPRAYRFEPKPSFEDMAARIRHREPNLKPQRDEGSLAMFHGLKSVFELVEPHLDDYDYVVRIRPDLFSELSLKEILVRISDEGDLLPDTVYVPRHFHSKGINDQLALGPVEVMRAYFRTFDYVERNIDTLFFNPESVLLGHLLHRDVALAVVDTPYALMRHEPFKLGGLHEAFHRQFGVWWSRTDDLPLFEDVSDYFRDKLAAMDAMMRGLVPDVLFVRAPGGGGADAVLRLHAVDNDPSRHASAVFDRLGFGVWAPFVLEDGGVVEVADPAPKQVFVRAEPDGGLTVCEWRWRKGRFSVQRVAVAAECVSPAAFGVGGSAAPTPRVVRHEPPGDQAASAEDVQGGVAGQLWPGRRLRAGARLESRNGLFALRLRHDGACELLDLRVRRAEPLWSSGSGGEALHLVMQLDGNVVLLDTAGEPIWASGTVGRPGAYLEVTADGAVVVSDGRDDFWRVPAQVKGIAAPVPTGSGVLAAGASLLPGDALDSRSGRSRLELTRGGALNVRTRATGGDRTMEVSPAPEGGEAVLSMQEDGNLVLYGGDGAHWSSGTVGHPGAVLRLTDDGVVTVTAAKGEELWRAAETGAKVAVAEPEAA